MPNDDDPYWPVPVKIDRKRPSATPHGQARAEANVIIDKPQKGRSAPLPSPLLQEYMNSQIKKNDE